MKKIMTLIITMMMSFVLVSCFKGETSLEKKSLIGKQFKLETDNITKVYEETIRYDANDKIEFDLDVKEGTAIIGLYSEDNTEVYSGNLTKGDMEFVVNIIEEGNYKLNIDLKNATVDFEIELKD